LLLKYGGLDQPQVQSRLLGEFERRGIDRSQVVAEGWSPPRELLAAYGRVDLSLDTQPYSGGVTTCDALWMGVPVLTYPGRTFAGRHSVSHLTNAGYEQFVASNPLQYVELAVEWAARLGELARMRSAIRERVRRSPLCDSTAFARDLLSVIRSAWRSLSISKQPV
jgi:predicted O-linked N-acetylglucosamine transferase (SPINDLY family)